MNDKNQDELIELINTFNQGDIAIIKSIFDANDIEYYCYDEHYSTFKVALPSRIMIRKSDIKKVEPLIKKLDLNFCPLSRNYGKK